MLVRVILVLILTKRELYFRRVCVYISKKTRVQRNLSSLAARAEGLFSLLFLIVADEQPLLPVVVLPAYIFQRATCCCSCSGCVTAPYDVNLFLVPSVCFYHVYSSLLFPFVFNSEAGFAELSLYIRKPFSIYGGEETMHFVNDDVPSRSNPPWLPIFQGSLFSKIYTSV